jgi:hypothetical protein
MRVRQNFALVLGLQGRFQDAEEVFRRDLPASEVAANMTALRRMIVQPNGLAAIRGVPATAQSSSRGKTEPVKTAAQKAPLPKTPAQKAADQKAAVQTAEGQKTPAQGSRLELRRF